MKKRPNQFSLNPFLIWFGLFGTIQKFDFGYFRNFICNYTITKFGTYITYPSRMVHYHGRSCYVLLLLCEHTTRWVIHILSYLFTFILFCLLTYHFLFTGCGLNSFYYRWHRGHPCSRNEDRCVKLIERRGTDVMVRDLHSYMLATICLHFWSAICLKNNSSST